MSKIKLKDFVIENQSQELNIVIKDVTRKMCGNCCYWDMKSRGAKKPIWACDNITWIGDDYIDRPNFEQISAFIYNPDRTESILFCPPRGFSCNEWRSK